MFAEASGFERVGSAVQTYKAEGVLLKKVATLLAFALLALGGAAACGSGNDDAVSQAELDAAQKETAQRVRQQLRIKELEEQLETQEKGGGKKDSAESDSDDASANPAPSGSSASSSGNCGSGISVNSNTSCPFAQNVAAEYRSSGAGSLEVFSPTTGQTYTMNCTSGSPVVCTGGNDAYVTFP